MLQKSISEQLQKSSQHSQNSKNAISKKIHFNEDNIRITHHSIEKDYGFISIPEPKTPYPRHNDALKAKELRRRLLEVLKRANSPKSQRDQLFNKEYEPQSPAPSLNEQYDKGYDKETRRSEFLKKRKQFYQSEFTITKQKPMSLEIPEPGPSIGNNWRIREYKGTFSLDSVPTHLKSFINKNTLENQNLLLNHGTLLEILKQQQHHH